MIPMFRTETSNKDECEIVTITGESNVEYQAFTLRAPVRFEDGFDEDYDDFDEDEDLGEDDFDDDFDDEDDDFDDEDEEFDDDDDDFGYDDDTEYDDLDE